MVDHSRMRTLGAIPRYHAAERPDAVAFTFEGRTVTYAEFDRNTDLVASGLIASGVKPGDRVAFLGKNSDHYFELFIGATKAGAVMVPVNWRLAPPEIAYIVDDAEAPILFVGPEFYGVIKKLKAELPKLREIIAMEGGEPEWPIFATWRDAQTIRELPVTTADDVALQLYTSGTTGRPKGAMLAHRNLLGMRESNAKAGLPWDQWSDDDVSLVAMPVSHIGGTGWGLMGIYNGAKNVVAREFNPNAVLDFIANDKVSKLFLVPAAMQIVLRDPRSRDVDYSRLKYILYGASPIPLELLREGMEVFKCGFVQNYGMTETCGTVVALPPDDHVPEGSPRMRSAGKPLPGVDIAIFGENGETLPPHQVGEIAIRSTANMVGYWHMEEATAKTIDADGWLRTGDAGYVDEDGYVYVHDRVKDMIISGGENVYPAEVENAVFGHPQVADVAVIGVPDERWGEAVKAIVVLKPGMEADSESIINWARERIAAYKTPKSIDFIEALPRNASGKILRRELREPYWAGKTRRIN